MNEHQLSTRNELTRHLSVLTCNRQPNNNYSNNTWQRNQLLNNETPSSSGRSTPYDPSRMTDRDLLSLESQNDEELSGLHSKVAMLKKVQPGRMCYPKRENKAAN